MWAYIKGIRRPAQELEFAIHRSSLTGNLLIDSRFRLPQSPERCPDHQRTIFGGFKSVDPPVTDPNLTEISTRLDDEFLFEVGAVPVNSEINTRPDVAVDNLRVALYVRMPFGGITVLDVVVDAKPWPTTLNFGAA